MPITQPRSRRTASTCAGSGQRRSSGRDGGAAVSRSPVSSVSSTVARKPPTFAVRGSESVARRSVSPPITTATATGMDGNVAASPGNTTSGTASGRALHSSWLGPPGQRGIDMRTSSAIAERRVLSVSPLKRRHTPSSGSWADAFPATMSRPPSSTHARMRSQSSEAGCTEYRSRIMAPTSSLRSSNTPPVVFTLYPTSFMIS